MKVINLNQLEKYHGGSFISDVCIGVEAGGLTLKTAAYLLAKRGVQFAIGGPLGEAVFAACTVYTIGSWLEIW